MLHLVENEIPGPTCTSNLLELIGFRIFIYVIFQINGHQLSHSYEL